MLKNHNVINRQLWLAKTLAAIPDGQRILDAGAGELQNRKHCGHLDYVSQDFQEYHGAADGFDEGLQSRKWDTSDIDLVSDILDIPAPDASFDVILCSEVLEHVPEPTLVLDEFSRLLKPGGSVIITAPFSANVHQAPYFFCTGFSKYWYQHHLGKRGFIIRDLVPNGNWYTLLEQEITRLGGLERLAGNWAWPLAYAYALLGLIYFRVRGKRPVTDLACFGWNCMAVKQT